MTFDRLQRILADMMNNFSEINMQMLEFETNRKQFMYDVGSLQ